MPPRVVELTVDCVHAAPGTHPGAVLCRLGLYGGHPSPGVCARACSIRQPEGSAPKPDPNPPKGPRPRDTAAAVRLQVAREVCPKCPKFRGWKSAMKVKCAAAPCQPCGISPGVEPCPEGRFGMAFAAKGLLRHGDISRATAVEDLRELIRQPLPGYGKGNGRPDPWPKGAMGDYMAGTPAWPNVAEAHRQEVRAFIKDLPTDPPAHWHGDGIVIAGGGKYFVSAYVTVRVLRHVGCKLPIDLWYLGRKNEITPDQAAILAPYGVTCVDADAVAEDLGREGRGPRILNGWELKPFAALHSRFERVLYLDADSYPVRDPAYLFDDPGFVRHGAIFWPDQPCFDLKPRAWEAFGLEPRQEYGFESGQFVVDKRRNWKPLSAAMWLNEHSDYAYEQFWGDKETFHIGWRLLADEGADYVMPRLRWKMSAPAGHKGHCMVQHDLDNFPIFQHRAMDKFTLATTNKGGKDHFWTTPQASSQTFNPSLAHEEFAFDCVKELARLLAGPEVRRVRDVPAEGDGTSMGPHQ